MSISAQALEDTRVWEFVGPISGGGTVFGLAISPVEDVARYWAATGCGIFFSDDEGHSWQQTLVGLTTPLLSALDVAPNGALFAGALGGDLFASFNYGRNWEAGLVPEELRATVTVVVASPSFQSDGTAFAATDGAGVLVTRNSGKTWEDSSFGLGDLAALALATTPNWERSQIMFAATTEGIFMSRNGGRAWRETELLMDDDAIDVLAASPTFDDDRTVLAGSENGDLYRTTDGGRTWDLVQKGLGDGPVNCLWLAPDFAESKRAVAGVGSQILVSTDGGDSWQASADMPGSILALTGDSQALLVGMHDAGIFRSVDGGSTWAEVEGFASRGFARLISADDKLFVMGPQEGLLSSADDGESWTSIDSLLPYLPVSAASLPGDGSLFVASQEGGILRSNDGGGSWAVVCDEAGVQALLVLPDANAGWAGTGDGRLVVSRDGGASWEVTGSPCEGQEIVSIVASPEFGEDHTLLMGTAKAAMGSTQARAALWRSTNGGADWRQLTTQVTPARWVDIEVPLGVEEDAISQAVVGTGAFCLRPLRRAKDVWISTRVDPEGANTLSVVAIGGVDQGGQLFAATGNGIFRSLDGGRTWHTFGDGLDSASFISLIARPKGDGYTLYALSLGGGLWKRDVE